MSSLSKNVHAAAARARNKAVPSIRVEDPMREIQDVGSKLSADPHDPNYDSEDSNLDGYVFTPSSDAPLSAAQLQEFRAQTTRIVHKLFASDDMGDFAASIEDLGAPALMYEVVRRLLTLAMEHNAKERELASRSLAFLVTSGVVDALAVEKAFERLFELAGDLELDIPLAKDHIARFLARAVSDEILPPAFLRNGASEARGADALSVVEQAKTLLSTRHSAARLSRVWGPASLVRTPEDGNDELKNEVKLLLTEYLASGDIDEAVECVRRLDAPHFHHEVVKRAIVIALDGRQRQRAMMSALLAELHARSVLASSQAALGFKRLQEEMEDLELDTPGAARVVKVFYDQAVEDGVLRD